jgi:hypothetical protein
MKGAARSLRQASLSTSLQLHNFSSRMYTAQVPNAASRLSLSPARPPPPSARAHEPSSFSSRLSHVHVGDGKRSFQTIYSITHEASSSTFLTHHTSPQTPLSPSTTTSISTTPLATQLATPSASMKILQVALAGLLGLAGLTAGAPSGKPHVAHLNDDKYT